MRLCGLNCCFTLLPLLGEMVAGRCLARLSGLCSHSDVRGSQWGEEETPRMLVGLHKSILKVPASAWLHSAWLHEKGSCLALPLALPPVEEGFHRSFHPVCRGRTESLCEKLH